MSQKYKITLASGRVLGPIDLDRVRALIVKRHVVGGETARHHPDGEWRPIEHFPEIAELLLEHISGGYDPLPDAQGGDHEPIINLPAASDPDEEKTIIAAPPERHEPEGKTEVFSRQIHIDVNHPPVEMDTGKNVAHEKTIFMSSRPAEASEGFKEKLTKKNIIRFGLIGLVAALAVSEFFSDPQRSQDKEVAFEVTFPEHSREKAAPEQSQKTYNEAMAYYVLDTVPGYRAAANGFRKAASQDISNVKALSMLASSYLNLVDSAVKGENYFDVITKLLEMSRAKGIEVPETVIADVEFYATVNKTDAAINRIVEFTKTNKSFGLEMFYYLAYAFYSQGDYTAAARYLSQYPEDRSFSARVFYLRGQLSERLAAPEDAIREYRKALKMNPDHAKSRLRMCQILYKQNHIAEAAPHLEWLMSKPGLLSPKDRALAYYLNALVLDAQKKWDDALKSAEKAVRIEKDNSDYKLEYYVLQAKAGEASVKEVRGKARMYFFLGEGERLFQKGNYQGAIEQFLLARQAEPDSPHPLVKAGDMFVKLYDLRNARINYQKATERAPNDIDIWNKYIRVLIDSYEWQDAKAAIEKISSNEKAKGSLEQLQGDLFAKQGNHAEALIYYRKAIAQSTINSDIYVSYARSLMALKQHKEAPFFFALALRFDPLNMEALIGTAQSLAESESIDRGIEYLKTELSKRAGNRAEVLCEIAELNIKKGDWRAAEVVALQATEINPNLPSPWKVLGRIYQHKAPEGPKWVEKALDTYKAYSDRNASDPSGYLERHAIFSGRKQYDKAAEELEKVFAIHPKFPGLHYYKGMLYLKMGNAKAGAEELEKERANNPRSVPTLMALGKLYLYGGELEGAMKNLKAAMELAPETAEPKYELGYLNFLMKNYQGAIALFQAAARYDPGNPLIYRRLGLAYQAVGDKKGMTEAFRKYLDLAPDAEDRAEFEKYL